MKTKLAALCAAALLLPAAAPANPFAAESAKIHTDDLDLSKKSDQRRLDIRLSEAAANVCGRHMDLIHNMLAEQSRQCQAEVIAENRARIEAMVASANSRNTLALK